MNQHDKEIYLKRYNERLELYGDSPETLGWGKNARQELRFQVLSDLATQNKFSSILDVGCGFADLYGFLKNKNWQGQYLGIDINKNLLNIALQKYPQVSVKQQDILQEELNQSYDYVIASGIFNAKLEKENNYTYIEAMLRTMYSIAKEAVCVDFLSTYVDYMQEIAWHSNPEEIIKIAHTISKRFNVRYDYMPYEFSLILYKNQTISNINTFEGFNLKHS